MRLKQTSIPTYQKQRGFTIVELLIVIVVIAILAAITIVAYNGIQTRARNSQTAAAVKTYLNAFSSYVALNSAYPSVDVNGNYCLGQDAASCVGSVALPNWQRSTTLENALATVISPLPRPSNGPGTNNTNDPALGYIPFRGGTASPTLDGANSAFLIYIIEGSARCPVGTIASGGWPNFSSTPPATGYTYGDSIRSTCWIALPRA